VNGQSTPVTASNLNALSCSVVEDVTEGGAVDDGADILARFATTTPAGSLRASMSDLVSGAAMEPSYEFGGDALQKATSVDGLSIPVPAQGWQRSRAVLLVGMCFRKLSP